MMNEAAVELSILVVGYHSCEHLPACLEAVRNAVSGQTIEILFIDNGTDGSDDLVRELFPEVRVLAGLGNIGFAAANNHLARHSQGRWLLLLNPDTEIFPDAIKALLEVARTNPDYGVLSGATLLDRTGTEVLPALHLPGWRSAWHKILERTETLPAAKTTSTVVRASAISGGFMLIDAKLWAQLRGLDEDFFLYGEDIDLCQRAAAAGWKIGTVPMARVYHDVGSGDFFSARRQLLKARGLATYHHKHFAFLPCMLLLGLMWLSMLARLALSAGLQLASVRYRSMFRALLPLVAKPWTWMKGYPRGSAADRKQRLI